MKRNPAANCGNCPYWASWTGTGSPDHIGECRQTSVKPNDTNQRWETTGANEWCGQHPDFWTHTPKKIVIGPEIVNCDYVPTKCESCKRQLSVTTDKDSPCYTCGHDFKNYKPFDDPGVLAMQALAETDRKEADT